MKIRAIKFRETGFTLLATLLIAGLFASILGAYLSMTSQESLTVKRSMGWNTAMPLAEAGIEEACSQVTVNTNFYGADGWTFNTNTWAFNKTRFLGDSYYSVDINGWAGGVIAITSTGYGAWTGSNYITRAVQITAQTPVPFIPSGLIANNIDFGGTFRADSYDSALGPYSARTATDHSLIGNPTGGFTLAGNSYVKGFVVTPGTALVTCQGSSTVGDASYHVNASIQRRPIDHWTNYTSIPTFPPVMPPFTNATRGVRIPTSGIVAGTHYDYVLLNAGFYYSSNLTASLYNKTMYVASNATLVLAGNVDLRSITFNPNTNASPKLSVFIGLPNLAFTPAVINAGPPQLWVYALPSCTSMKITSADFVGVIYAPDMALTASGNSSVCGAIVAKSFTCTGTFDFHFDDATGGNAAKAFKILSWAEL